MNTEKIWNRIKQNEGNLFYTITGKEYRYVVYNDFLLIDDRKDRRVTKEAIAKAMTINIIPARKQAIKGIIDQKISNSILSRNVRFIKNSITTHRSPTAMKDAPAI